MNVQKEARRDAREYARAQMYYGEGAGNRRKLINAAVATKTERRPGYSVAFNRELGRQDMAEHAEAARKERRRRDVTHAINKNVKNAAAGNYAGVNAMVLVVAAATYVAHQTGYDKRIIDSTKRKIHAFKARREARVHKAAAPAPETHAGVHNITSI